MAAHTRSRTRHPNGFVFRTLLALDVDADKITAALADGALTVTLPKSASARSRRMGHYRLTVWRRRSRRAPVRRER
ncbi:MULTISPECIES: Hsp20 family protein [unclassified Rhodococcus (in: high G+C Gram-positive bacteria)]|uniref:Hsp20 family protein n=1 Tax=unclassified Rhodococcus (in: high G+C Gram-positive bacteria) TaxID=192944 RepID=UPI0002A44F06|nr:MULTISPECIES: Hsp20 family protein [unclassified Rhodococcus (in: high G+C Gram-positive bacteria)]ELB86980.1 small heat shock protein [Rhodococcus wratislaviensis IFP 2016]